MKPCSTFLIRALVLSSLSWPVSSVLAAPLVCLIQPSRTAEIGSSVTGVIESLRVERGDSVKKGQVIAVLRNDVERAAYSVAQSRAQADADVQAAQVALAFSRQSTERGLDLYKKKFISEQALDKTRTEEKVAAQKLAQAHEQRRTWDREMSLAKSQLNQRTLVSPISGIVAERYLSIGERVEDRPVARVVSINPLHIEVMVPATEFGKIKSGMTATVMPELPDAAPLEARVNLVDRLIDGASNTFRVRLELPNPGNAIPAGPRCKITFNDTTIGTVGSSAPLSTARPKVAPASLKTPSQPPSPQSAAPKADSVLSALEQWRAAWERKDVAAYLAAYVTRFKGDSPDREAWIKLREARIAKPGNLTIQVMDPQIQLVSEGKARVQFKQAYQSPTYRADTPKSLLMVWEKGKWLIQDERTTEM